MIAITNGALADRVVDMTSGSTRPIVDAVEAVRPGGTIVLAGEDAVHITVVLEPHAPREEWLPPAR